MSSTVALVYNSLDPYHLRDIKLLYLNIYLLRLIHCLSNMNCDLVHIFYPLLSQELPIESSYSKFVIDTVRETIQNYLHDFITYSGDSMTFLMS